LINDVKVSVIVTRIFALRCLFYAKVWG